MQLARKCDKGEKNILLKCADHLKRLHQFAYCVEVYNKLGDKKAVVMLHVDTQNWDEVSLRKFNFALELIAKYKVLEAHRNK